MPEIQKIFAILSIFFMLTNCIYAQETEFGQNTKEIEQTEIQPLQQGFSPDVSVSLGTSFASFAPGYNSFGTFIAPEIIFPVSNRFAISTGVGYSSIFYSTPGDHLLHNQPMQYGSIYLSGSYKMNEKITISSTGYKTFLLNPPETLNESNQHSYNNSNQGVILNLDYKVTESFRINASFQFHQQNGSPYNAIYPGYNFSPYDNMGGISPFINHSFYPGF
jgi:hypothetical protein